MTTHRFVLGRDNAFHPTGPLTIRPGDKIGCYDADGRLLHTTDAAFTIALTADTPPAGSSHLFVDVSIVCLDG
jgi:hypothetical protein